ncbi:MAG: hypothetical protein WBP81_35555, partial [Solirubrobacteraceae bacterium]
MGASHRRFRSALRLGIAARVVAVCGAVALVVNVPGARAGAGSWSEVQDPAHLPAGGARIAAMRNADGTTLLAYTDSDDSLQVSRIASDGTLASTVPAVPAALGNNTSNPVLVR